MEKLVCTLDNKLIGEYPFNKDKLTIGRNPKADIVIDNLAVSGIHAHVNKIGIDFLIEDNNSTNGTFVNEKPIKKHVLNEGDVILIGRFEFKLMREQTAKISSAAPVPQTPTPKAQAPQASAKPAIQTPIAQTPAVQATAAQPAVESSPTQEKPKPPAISNAQLLILNGEQKGSQIALNKSMFSHAIDGQKIVITKRDNGFFISQIEGDKPIAINGQPLTTLTYKLNKNDVILISDINHQFID
jgi:pSer/pThr/pTyr-binding forkhead associated (FHA) protein